VRNTLAALFINMYDSVKAEMQVLDLCRYQPLFDTVF
jgi:hypothetical protein